MQSHSSLTISSITGLCYLQTMDAYVGFLSFVVANPKFPIKKRAPKDVTESDSHHLTFGLGLLLLYN